MCQTPGATDLIELTADWDPKPLGDNRSAAKFFGVERARTINFGPNLLHTSTYVHIWVDEAWEMFKDWREIQSPLPLKDYLDAELIYKYIVPQMVNNFHLTPIAGPLLWDFHDYDVAPS